MEYIIISSTESTPEKEAGVGPKNTTESANESCEGAIGEQSEEEEEAVDANTESSGDDSFRSNTDASESEGFTSVEEDSDDCEKFSMTEMRSKLQELGHDDKSIDEWSVNVDAISEALKREGAANRFMGESPGTRARAHDRAR